MMVDDSWKYYDILDQVQRSPELLLYRSRVNIKLNRHSLAFRDLQALLRLDPHHAEALALLGSVHVALGNYRSAEECLTAALAKEPRNEWQTAAETTQQLLVKVSELCRAYKSLPQDGEWWYLGAHKLKTLVKKQRPLCLILANLTDSGSLVAYHTLPILPTASTSSTSSKPPPPELFAAFLGDSMSASGIRRRPAQLILQTIELAKTFGTALDNSGIGVRALSQAPELRQKRVDAILPYLIDDLSSKVTSDSSSKAVLSFPSSWPASLTHTDCHQFFKSLFAFLTSHCAAWITVPYPLQLTIRGKQHFVAGIWEQAIEGKLRDNGVSYYGKGRLSGLRVFKHVEDWAEYTMFVEEGALAYEDVEMIDSHRYITAADYTAKCFPLVFSDSWDYNGPAIVTPYILQTLTTVLETLLVIPEATHMHVSGVIHPLHPLEAEFITPSGKVDVCWPIPGSTETMLPIETAVWLPKDEIDARVLEASVRIKPDGSSQDSRDVTFRAFLIPTSEVRVRSVMESAESNSDTFMILAEAAPTAISALELMQEATDNARTALLTFLKSLPHTQPGKPRWKSNMHKNYGQTPSPLASVRVKPMINSRAMIAAIEAAMNGDGESVDPPLSASGLFSQKDILHSSPKSPIQFGSPMVAIAKGFATYNLVRASASVHRPDPPALTAYVRAIKANVRILLHLMRFDEAVELCLELVAVSAKDIDGFLSEIALSFLGSGRYEDFIATHEFIISPDTAWNYTHTLVQYLLTGDSAESQSSLVLAALANQGTLRLIVGEVALKERVKSEHVSAWFGYNTPAVHHMRAAESYWDSFGWLWGRHPEALNWVNRWVRSRGACFPLPDTARRVLEDTNTVLYLREPSCARPECYTPSDSVACQACEEVGYCGQRCLHLDLTSHRPVCNADTLSTSQ